MSASAKTNLLAVSILVCLCGLNTSSALAQAVSQWSMPAPSGVVPSGVAALQAQFRRDYANIVGNQRAADLPADTSMGAWSRSFGDSQRNLWHTIQHGSPEELQKLGVRLKWQQRQYQNANDNARTQQSIDRSRRAMRANSSMFEARRNAYESLQNGDVEGARRYQRESQGWQRMSDDLHRQMQKALFR